MAGHHHRPQSLDDMVLTDRGLAICVNSTPEIAQLQLGDLAFLVQKPHLSPHKRFARITDLEFKEIERIFNVNFWGMVNLTKAFLPHLLERPEAHIVNISSMGGFLPVPGQTAYGASKAAVSLFKDGLHSKLLDTNVHITANSDVSMQLDSGSMKKLMANMTSPSVAAEVIIDGMEKNKYHVLVSIDAKMMDLLHRLNPEQAAKIISSQMDSLLPN